MKTVSGVVLSSKPVSLSKAAKILSKFAAADNGASPAYAYYLNSASESFDELVQLHKELRGADSERRSKKHRSGIRDEVEEPVNSVQNYGEDDEIKENGVAIGKKDVKEKKSGADGRRRELEVKEPKKKKSTRDENVERRSHGNSDAVENGVGGKKREKEAKKVNKEVIEEGRSNGVSKAENREEKRSKKRKSEEIASANGEENDSAEKLVQHKKRKSEEIASANGEVNDSAEKLVQHKKRKKTKIGVEN